MLDALAAEACAALAHDDGSRRTARAIERYDRAQGLVAAARTCRELEAAIARDRLRLAAWELAGRGAERLRALLPAGAARPPVAGRLAGESDAAFAAALAAVADDLAQRGDPLALGRLDLRDALARRLRRRVGPLTVVIPEDAVRLRGWPEGIAVVDLGVRGRMAGRQRAVACCAWWSGEEERRRTVGRRLPDGQRRARRRRRRLPRRGRPAGRLGRRRPRGPPVPRRRARHPAAAARGRRRARGRRAPRWCRAACGTVAVAREPLGPTAAGWELRAARVEPAGGDLEVG